MALQRKPVKSNAEPTYPDGQSYANDRREFLVKLGLTAAGLFTLAGCGEAANVQSNALQNSPPIPVTSPSTVIPQTQPVAPITAMPGAPPPPQNIPNTLSPQPINATPQACTPGKPSASSLIQTPVQPQTAVPGGVAPPQNIPPAPVQPQAQAKGEAPALAVPAPAQPLASMRGNVAMPVAVQPKPEK